MILQEFQREYPAWALPSLQRPSLALVPPHRCRRQLGQVRSDKDKDKTVTECICGNPHKYSETLGAVRWKR